MTMINSHFGFTPLREVWLGDVYPASWYDHLPNEVADPFRQITEWTKHDLNKLQSFLESRGIAVQRPVFHNISDHINQQGYLVKPPITPRDDYLVLGNTLYAQRKTTSRDPWQDILDQYQRQGLSVNTDQNMPVNCLSGPSLVRVGKDLYLDRESHNNVWGFICQWMVETAQHYRVNISTTDGHSDSVFCPVAPGVIVTSHWKNQFHHTFPGWEVYKIPRQLNNWLWGGSNNWQVGDDNIDQNVKFNLYIEKMAQSWVGNFKETVFEVNMLVLDQHNVVAMKPYEPLAKWLEQRGITMHCFDFRCRNFWDGGWHCLTLDIHRDDQATDLFPDRGTNGVYWRQENEEFV